MKKITNVVSKVEEILLSFSVIAMAIILVAGVVARVVFNASLTFTEELGVALNTAVTFLGIGYCARNARHISMSIVFDLLNEKAKKVMMTIIALGTAAVMFFLCYLSIRYVSSVMNLGRVTPALRIPMWTIYTTLPIGFFIGGVDYLHTFVKNITDRGTVWISGDLRLGDNVENYDDPEETAEKEANE